MRSNVLHVGAYFVIQKVIAQYGLEKRLKAFFGDKAGILLDLAQQQIVTEGHVAQYFSTFARNHLLFNAGMSVYSDAALSRTLAKVTDDQIQAFLDQWNQTHNPQDRVYLSYDSTPPTAQAGDLAFIELAYEKADLDTPILKVGLAFDASNRVPLFYDCYPGFMSEMGQLNYMVGVAGSYHYRNIGILLDRGSVSKSVVDHMDANGFAFLMRVKVAQPLVSELVKDHRGTFEYDWNYQLNNTELHAKTFERPLYSEDSKERFFHLFFSPSQMATERSDVVEAIKFMAAQLRQLEGTETVLGAPYTQYFDCQYRSVKSQDGSEKQIFVAANENVEAIGESLKLCGYFALISSEKMTAAKAYELYQGHNVPEKLFSADEAGFDEDPAFEYSNRALAAKRFVEFLALIIRNQLYHCLTDARLKSSVRTPFMTVSGAIRELEKIEMTRFSGDEYRLDFVLTKPQKCILEAFGIDEATVLQHATAISGRLKKLGDSDFVDLQDEDDAFLG